MSEQPPSGPPTSPPSGPPTWTPPPPSWGAPPPPPPPPTPPGRDRRLVVALGVMIVLVIAVAAVAIPLALRGTPDREIGTDAGAPAPTGSASATNLDAVKKYDGLTNAHITTPHTYPQTPPVGGDHFPIWMDCGVYDQPINDENAVHDLEHGTVWITYEPGLDAADVATLADALPQNGILSPYPGLPAPVVVTVWGRQLYLTGADDPRLPLFVRTFRDGVTAPEPQASCAGGLTDPAGGTG